jgi:hypothetical protein
LQERRYESLPDNGNIIDFRLQDLEKYVDAHLLRPGTDQGKWEKLSFLLQELTNNNETLLSWANQYRDDYIRVGGGVLNK